MYSNNLLLSLKSRKLEHDFKSTFVFSSKRRLGFINEDDGAKQDEKMINISSPKTEASSWHDYVCDNNNSSNMFNMIKLSFHFTDLFD